MSEVAAVSQRRNDGLEQRLLAHIRLPGRLVCSPPGIRHSEERGCPENKTNHEPTGLVHLDERSTGHAVQVTLHGVEVLIGLIIEVSPM